MSKTKKYIEKVNWFAISLILICLVCLGINIYFGLIEVTNYAISFIHGAVSVISVGGIIANYIAYEPRKKYIQEERKR